MQRRLAAAATVLALGGCAELNQLGALVQPPRFEQVPDQPAEIRLAGLNGAGVRLWARVSNPNAFGLTLGTLKGTLYLDEARAATADFPLGLPLGARGDTVIPIDISISFADLPGLGGVARRVLARQPLPYRLEGTIGVDAGRFGQPVFGPMTLLAGQATAPLAAAGSRAADRAQQTPRGLPFGPVRVQPIAVGLRAEPGPEDGVGVHPGALQQAPIRAFQVQEPPIAGARGEPRVD